MRNVESVDDFDQISEENEDTLFVVDFWASWCGPCKALMPVLESVSETLEEEGIDAEIVKVSIEDLPSLAKRFEVKSIPTLMFLQDGSEVSERVIGTSSENDLLDLIQEIVS